MERMSYNHEVASALIYLSEASSYVTGENMLVEGMDSLVIELSSYA